MNQTKIDWCTHTLNPVVGCTYGCAFCYAKKMNTRFGWIPKWEEPQFFPERLKMLESKTPKIIFMDSVSDIADWRYAWVELVFENIKRNPQHKYLFLTKRQEETFKRIECFEKPSNVFIGTSICTNGDMELNALVAHGDADFYSIEPILEPIRPLFSKPTKWVIIGAETGNRKDKVVPKREWIKVIVDGCRRFSVPVFMKSSLANIWGAPLIQEYPW